MAQKILNAKKQAQEEAEKKAEEQQKTDEKGSVEQESEKQSIMDRLTSARDKKGNSIVKAGYSAWLGMAQASRAGANRLRRSFRRK